MTSIFAAVQPVIHPQSHAAGIECSDPERVQREIRLLAPLSQADFCTDAQIAGWQSYREAVVWCWANQRFYLGIGQQGKALLFAQATGMHPPHVSRCVKDGSRAPMDLPPQHIPAFESFTGLRGVSQWLMRQAELTCLEELQAARRRA